MQQEVQEEASAGKGDAQGVDGDALTALAEAMEKLSLSRMRLVNPKVRDILVWTIPLPANEKCFMEFEDPMEDSLLSIVNSALLVRLPSFTVSMNALLFTSDAFLRRLPREPLSLALASWR